MKKKRTLIRLITLMLAINASIIFANAHMPGAKSSAATVAYSGTCGANVTWTLDTAGKLTISGKGEMYDYALYEMDEDSHMNPWRSERLEVKSVVIENGVTSIGDFAFEELGVESITMSDSVTSIGLMAFAFANIKTIDLSDGLTEMDNSAFYSCQYLTEITIPSGVKTLNGCLFLYCNSLKTIIIPESVTSIEGSAFGSCSNLKDVYYAGSSASWKAINISDVGNSALTSATIHYNMSEEKETLSACSISSLKNSAKGITLKWNAVSAADGYYIYRKTSSGSYSKIKTITSGSTVSYTDTAVKKKNGTTYTYKVVPYSGTTSGTGTAKKTVRLTGTTLSSVKNSASKKATVKWEKTNKVSGYQIQYSTSKTFASGNKTVTVSGASKTSKTLTGLKKGKTYYVRVRTYKTVSGTKYYSAWSSVEKVKISK